MRPKILAFYLPQYYPIPENDEWWGKGFTEWTNVGRAKPLYKGHYQPKVPSELGYYDLRLPIVREQQAALAKEYGVDGFCYWHYWFGNGKRLLDLVENEVVESGKPDFPFSFFWANHSWAAKNWNLKDSKPNHRVLIYQDYPGKEDYEAHFMECLKAFKDKRYIKEGNKPVFGVFDASTIPDPEVFISIWNDLAVKNGFDGIYFFCYCMSVQNYEQVKHLPFNEFVVDPLNLIVKQPPRWLLSIKAKLSVFTKDNLEVLKLRDYNEYAKSVVDFFREQPDTTICVLPNYDHSPRSGKFGVILNNSTPSNFKTLLSEIHSLVLNRQTNKKYLFIKSWNEWGEGNYLEPDLKYGRGFLNAIKEVFGLSNE